MSPCSEGWGDAGYARPYTAQGTAGTAATGGGLVGLVGRRLDHLHLGQYGDTQGRRTAARSRLQCVPTPRCRTVCDPGITHAAGLIVRAHTRRVRVRAQRRAGVCDLRTDTVTLCLAWLLITWSDVAQGLACRAESLTHINQVSRLGRGWRGVRAGQRDNVLTRSSLERASPKIVMQNMP